MRFSHSGI